MSLLPKKWGEAFERCLCPEGWEFEQTNLQKLNFLRGYLVAILKLQTDWRIITKPLYLWCTTWNPTNYLCQNWTYWFVHKCKTNCHVIKFNMNVMMGCKRSILFTTAQKNTYTGQPLLVILTLHCWDVLKAKSWHHASHCMDQSHATQCKYW